MDIYKYGVPIRITDELANGDPDGDSKSIGEQYADALAAASWDAAFGNTGSASDGGGDRGDVDGEGKADGGSVGGGGDLDGAGVWTRDKPYFIAPGNKPGTWIIRYTDEDGNPQSVTVSDEADGGPVVVPPGGAGPGSGPMTRLTLFLRQHDWQLLGLVVGLASVGRGILLAWPGVAVGRSFDPYRQWMPVELWGLLLAVCGLALLATLSRPLRVGAAAAMLLFGLWFWQAFISAWAGVLPQAWLLFVVALGAAICYAKLRKGVMGDADA